jgi:hypothetical protein
MRVHAFQPGNPMCLHILADHQEACKGMAMHWVICKFV